MIHNNDHLRDDLTLYPAIMSVEENTKGEDYFIGDLHGRFDLLSLVLAKMRAEDRLFLVGDLTDRGPDSYKVIECIFFQGMKNAKPKVYTVRGNHEEVFLAFANAREYITSHYPIDTSDFRHQAAAYLKTLYHTYDIKREALINKKNERKEAAKEFALIQEKLNEISEGYIHTNHMDDLQGVIDLSSDQMFKQANQTIIKAYETAEAVIESIKKAVFVADNECLQAALAYESYKEKYDIYKHARFNLLRFDNPAAFGRSALWVDELTNDQLHTAIFAISHLPYIITSPQFNVVHADLPFSDVHLQRKITTADFSLSDAEKNYAIWARLTESFVLIDREKVAASGDRYTICGHTIAEGLREFSKHINLDYGAFESNCIGVLNLKRFTIEVIGDKTAVLKNGKTAESHSIDLIHRIKACQ
ncbi:MAG: metallophosphoesterase [Gammaproteobacteria bacterium]|nr:metallophosphoesterase [Gammaproteobacteria bacterium]